MTQETDNIFPVAPSDHSWNLARSLGIRRKDAIEDFLTESFAGAMNEDQALARSVLGYIHPYALLGDNNAANNHVEIETQVGFANSTVDLVFRTLHARVGLEIKLRSPEGPGQLAKYLEITDLDVVAFLAPNIRSVASNVYNHPKYCRPQTRHRHFLWSDFYPFVAIAVTEHAANSTTRKGLVGLFDHLDLTPIQNDQIVLISDKSGQTSSKPMATDGKTSAKQKVLWNKLLRQTRSSLQRLGWGFANDQPGEIWTDVRRRRLAQIWVDCVNRPGYLRVNLRFPETEYRSLVATELSAPTVHFSLLPYELKESTSVGKEKHTRYTLFVMVPYALLLKDHTGYVDIENRLSRFVTSIVRRAEEALR